MKKPIIPILYKNCKIPYLLDTIPRIELTSERMDDEIAFNKLFNALGIAESPIQKLAEVKTLKEETLVPATDITIDNPSPVGSDVSDAQTSPKQTEVSILYKPDVYIGNIKYSTIQEALNAGNPGETIILADGIYQENLRIDKPFMIKGAGVGKTIIDGCQAGSAIIIGWNRDNIDVTLTGITVTGGTGTKDRIDPSPTPYVCGGGIFNKGELTIKNCIISDNAAHCGGGIFNKGAIKLEEGAFIIHNAAYNGGGIYGIEKEIILNGGTVASNEAEQLGGGFYVGYRGRITIQSGTISNNVAKNSGGGIYCRSLLTMQGGEIFSNDAFSSGGGIYCSGSASHLNGGSVHNNIARIGAGAVNGGGEMILDGTRIHHNTADRNGNGIGGGIHNSGTLILNNGSIDHNHASKEGGGIKNNELNGKLTGDLALVQYNTLGSDHIPDNIAPLELGRI